MLYCQLFINLPLMSIITGVSYHFHWLHTLTNRATGPNGVGNSSVKRLLQSGNLYLNCFPPFSLMLMIGNLNKVLKFSWFEGLEIIKGGTFCSIKKVGLKLSLFSLKITPIFHLFCSAKLIHVDSWLGWSVAALIQLVSCWYMYISRYKSKLVACCCLWLNRSALWFSIGGSFRMQGFTKEVK